MLSAILLMTGAATISQFRNALIIMLAGFIIIGMTTRTIGTVGVSPGNDFVVIAVAGLTAKILAMLAGILTRVHITCRRPGLGGVAVITFDGGDEVAGIFTRSGITIMTARAGALYLVMIDSSGWCPGQGRMAGLTNVARLNMLGILAGGGIAIVTADTIAADAGMVKYGGRPGLGGMAIITLATGSQVIGVFTGGGIAIMTTRTGAQHLVMIDGRRR